MEKINIKQRRSVCDACGYLDTNCVFQWVPKLQCRHRIVIFQHLKEAKHAKNTVRLLRLALPQIEVVTLASANTLSDWMASITPNNWRLIYPAPSSTALELESNCKDTPVEGFILIDATWRKALSIYESNPCLADLPVRHFAQVPQGYYSIRKSSKENSLSTLEACAYAIECIEQSNMEGLREFFRNAQKWQWRHIPTT